VGQIYFGDLAGKWVRFESALTDGTIRHMNLARPSFWVPATPSSFRVDYVLAPAANDPQLPIPGLEVVYLEVEDIELIGETALLDGWS
jgi:hypothetical protein